MEKVHIATYQENAKHLSEVLPEYNQKVVIRLGGTKNYEDYPIQVNSAESIKNSIDKLQQKKLLIKAGIKTLPLIKWEEADYPFVVKGIVRSCGNSVFVTNNNREFKKATEKLKDKYIIEPLFKATGEYRLHCTRTENFFSVKKIKRNPEDIIITSKNHFNKRDFVKPRLYKEMQQECIKAMNVLNLDIACFDVMYNSSNPDKHDFTIAEANTNPELLANTFEAYKTALIDIINKKAKEIPNAYEKLLSFKLTKDELLASIEELPEGYVASLVKIASQYNK